LGIGFWWEIQESRIVKRVKRAKEAQMVKTMAGIEYKEDERIRGERERRRRERRV